MISEYHFAHPTNLSGFTKTKFNDKIFVQNVKKCIENYFSIHQESRKKSLEIKILTVDKCTWHIQSYEFISFQDPGSLLQRDSNARPHPFLCEKKVHCKFLISPRDCSS